MDNGRLVFLIGRIGRLLSKSTHGLVCCLVLTQCAVQGTTSTDKSALDGVDAAGADDEPGDPPPDSPKQSAFDGVPKYASQPVAKSAASHHKDKKVEVVPDGDADCLSCHSGKGAPKFVLAGTVYASDTGGKGVPDIEVRIGDANGTSVSAHTDADGNFWIAVGKLPSKPAYAGVRSAKGSLSMAHMVEDFSCNTCHTAQQPIYRP